MLLIKVFNLMYYNRVPTLTQIRLFCILLALVLDIMCEGLETNNNKKLNRNVFHLGSNKIT